MDAAPFPVGVGSAAKLNQSNFRRAQESHRDQRAADTGTRVSLHRSLPPEALPKAALAIGGRHRRPDQRQPDLPGMSMSAEVERDSRSGGFIDQIRAVGQQDFEGPFGHSGDRARKIAAVVVPNIVHAHNPETAIRAWVFNRRIHQHADSHGLQFGGLLAIVVIAEDSSKP